MDILNIINAWVVGLGIPTIVAAAIYIGRKLQILDDLDPIRKDFVIVQSRVNDLWQDRIAPPHSPRQLNERGKSILEKSGIKEIINNKKDTLLKIVKEKNATNPYDAETTILSIVADLPNHCPDVVEKLKTGAFGSGASMNDVLLVGGIYLRNLIFPELGFSVEELDKPKT